MKRLPKLTRVTVEAASILSLKLSMRPISMSTRSNNSRYSAMIGGLTINCSRWVMNHESNTRALADCRVLLKKKPTITFVSRTTGTRALRGGTLFPLFRPIFADDPYRITFLVTTLAGLAAHGFRERNIFGNLKMLAEKFSQQLARLLLLFACLFLKIRPQFRPD